MSFSLTEADREALGLQTVTFGMEQFVGVLPDLAGYGRAHLAEAATLMALLAGGHFSTPRVDAADRVGMRISACDERPAVVRVIDESGTGLEAKGIAPVAEWVQPDPEDPATVFLDLSNAGFVSVRKRDGRGLLLRWGTNGFFVMDFHPTSGGKAALTMVRTPIGSWCTSCDDPWLVGEMQSRAQSEDGWQHAVAAGLYARLGAPPQQPAKHVERLLGGAEGPPVTPARAWARELTAEQVEMLADRALVAADRLGRTLDDLYEHMAPGEDSWLSSFQAACVERDDIEAVRLILTERGGAARLVTTLDQLDRAGRRLTAAIPRVLTLNDERLYRARLADPHAWWAALAEPEHEA